ncbi:single-stranded DNA-binding protein [Nocardia cyriacigeorgica]|uniref:single-stranded DNA-binding protein n=1 Tax=Nocardia cyriacigeorgica TaxID=135487 RepID=UPI001893BE2C|nr:single-stranded DNA-binding protein [Nocardia cyriacigeorgica]MBF6326483.1 single-stranded DNA-binding protein [Nocardia cyriacigeorgica]
MSAEVTMIGGLTAPPELRFTSGGKAVVSFTLAHTPRFLDKDTNEWKDAGDPLYLRCNLWGQAAENLAESGLDKGDRLIAVGKLKSRSWEDRDGNKRTSTELEVSDVGPTVKNAIVTVTKAGGSGGGGKQDSGWGSAPAAGQYDDSEVPF